MDRLKGKTALITGAARGIGAQIARRFADEGAKVIINDLSLEAARATASNLGGHGVAADVSDSAAVAAMFAEVKKLTPRLDILVNNAGISGIEGRTDIGDILSLRMKQADEAARGGPVETFLDVTVATSDAGWRKMLGVHVDGTFFCCREALKIMNPQMSGSIINMGSIMGTYGKPAGSTSYSTAKAAIMGFTRALAHEVAPRGIRVNSIAPGYIDTDMTAPLGEFRKRIASQTPLQRFGDTDDIAWAAVYLASDEAKFMTGQVISPNGGWYMSQ
ncbi:MAG TPA: SDR family NAD(P)-dependent oxidoreductase [Hyphomicrobiaceae bacterium]|nr:SDR family NAD(P)-dependent oxidoreductase [Hyphomicrobiaceae bacterium]